MQNQPLKMKRKIRCESNLIISKCVYYQDSSVVLNLLLTSKVYKSFSQRPMPKYYIPKFEMFNFLFVAPIVHKL